ncbi:hypothetical protein ACNUDN_12720 [Mycobacterium sp. smrl_JER01]
MGGHTVFGSGGSQRMAIYGILIGVIALGTDGFRSRTDPDTGIPVPVGEMR